MRLVIIIPASFLLLVCVFLLGITCTTPAPEQLFPAPKTAAEFLSRGRLYEKHGNLEKALADYTQASRLEPTNNIALLYQASALATLNRPAEAIQKYQVLRKRYQQTGYSAALINYSIQEQQKKLYHKQQQK